MLSQWSTSSDGSRCHLPYNHRLRVWAPLVLNVISVWWSMWFAPDKYQVCEIPMWHSDMNGIFVEHGQIKIGIILRCCKMKTLSGCMMTGVLLWWCWMIVEEYMLGCWMDECIWLMHSIHCVMTSEDGSNSLKNGFWWTDGLRKVENYFQWIANSFW